MNLADVMDELGAALETIDGLRVYPYSADNVQAPAAIVAWPEDVQFDTAFVRGADRQTMQIYVLTGRLDARTSRNLLARYLDGAGQTSIKEAVDGFAYTACDSVRVESCTPDAYIVGGTTYFGGLFKVDVIGKGA